ncbi:MAG: hydantoinase B/oxoprolinase family protein, partial [Reyranellaceae bacterium]
LLEDAPFALSATFERIDNPPRGRAGGQDGLPGIVRTESGAPMKAKGYQTIGRGDRLIVEMPGGGGLGDARRRPVQEVLADVDSGLVSPEAARRDYGVVMKNGALDDAATQKLRASR